MQRERAVTFVEALVVLAIISIIAAIVFATAAPARERARQAVCINNLKQIYKALLMYSSDHDAGEALPGLGTIQPAKPYDLFAYGLKQSQLYCPDASEEVRERWLTTYSWGLLGLTSQDATRAKEQLAWQVSELGLATPIITCRVHDEVYYAPRERHVADQFAGVFVIQLMIDGSVRTARVPGRREPLVTRELAAVEGRQQ